MTLWTYLHLHPWWALLFIWSVGAYVVRALQAWRGRDE
jgi:hypothetical protein